MLKFYFKKLKNQNLIKTIQNKIGKFIIKKLTIIK